MTQKNIFTAAEAEDLAVYFSDSKVRTNIVTTGEHMQLIWAKFEPDGRYQLHSHPHEQVSVMLQGRMRLTVGDEVREIGPGDMWFAPANVLHGGEFLGEDPVVFIDVYGPPSKTFKESIEKARAAET